VSWSATFPNPVPAHSPLLLHNQDPICSPPREQWSPELEAIFAEAVDAAVALIARGAVGDGEDQQISVSMFGHTNPGKVPAVGWVKDWLQINLRQL